jgi:hypothetical protein
MVYPDYFAAMGIRLREGRTFSPSDGRNTLQAVIVNETLARKYFGNRSAIGHRLKNGSPESQAPWLTIVGVATDVKQRGVDQPTEPELYNPALQQDSNAVINFLREPAFIVRTAADPTPIIDAVRRTARRVGPELPLVGLENDGRRRHVDVEPVLQQRLTRRVRVARSGISINRHLRADRFFCRAARARGRYPARDRRDASRDRGSHRWTGHARRGAWRHCRAIQRAARDALHAKPAV